MRGGLLLAIESSCDETGVALLDGPRRIVAQAVASQVALHAGAGGVVPELAARAHLRWLDPALDAVLAEAAATLGDVGAIAVTAGPGLVGSLLVGLSYAKALAWGIDVPLVGVNHLEGHLYAAWLLDPGEPDRPEPAFPLVALVVSGGHTFLVEMRDHLSYRLLGETVDDAAGEAFDKAGRLLNLGYPGGPAIAQAAEEAGSPADRLPRAWLGTSYDFSFSGLKTALRRLVEAELAAAGLPSTEAGGHLEATRVAALAAAFQESVVDVLATKTLRAAEALGARTIVAGGGVASNVSLRRRLAAGAAGLGVELVIPRAGLCTDNGAMIGAAGARRLAAGETSGLDLGVRASWPLARPPGTPESRRPPTRGGAARAYDRARNAEADAAGRVTG
ncbi:MAG TPA: tRNA (adenosine(37)-N6)-threonylcarbamoyltransferase complex transferase subunit TsaD [Patescibacteria group bacterium]|nr:tRNA (adenosine(37)-N6)-threonylcarbamoyltransferase complex transferase subunit TsaD [Patescibacteria group bacterium]